MCIEGSQATLHAFFGLNVTFGGKENNNVRRTALAPTTTEYVEKVVEKPVEVVREVVKDNTQLVQTTYVVTFEINQSVIEDTTELNGIPAGSNVEIVAYASPEGPADFNAQLSENRAKAVADYLQGRGVNVIRTIAKGANSKHSNRIAIVTIVK